jgi:hypothetical protein
MNSIKGHFVGHSIVLKLNTGGMVSLLYKLSKPHQAAHQIAELYGMQIIKLFKKQKSTAHI